MNLQNALHRPRALPLFAVAMTVIVALASLAIGQHIGKSGLTYQDLVVAAVALGIAIIALQQRGLEIGFTIWIGMFALGYRVARINVPVLVDLVAGGGLGTDYLTTHVTTQIVLHPLVVIMFGLFLLLSIQRATAARPAIAWRWPPLLLLFSLFWITGWVEGVNYGIFWNDMWRELQNFVLIFPVFWVTAHILQKDGAWRSVVIAFYAVATLIALLGLVEYVFPGIRTIIPGYILTTGDLVLVAQDGFERARFSFWGAPNAIFVTVLAMPLVVILWVWNKRQSVRLIIIAALLIQIIGIYIAGWRSIWVLCLGIVIAMLSIRRRWFYLFGLITCVFIGYNLLPDIAHERLETLLSAAQGNFHDTSSLKRVHRIEDALREAFDTPMGLGWSGSGWVHNDFLQVTANLGVIAGLLFLAWYGRTLYAIWRLFEQTRDTLVFALVGCFLFAGGLLFAQNMIVLPQNVFPLWFVWAMVETRLNLARQPETFQYGSR